MDDATTMAAATGVIIVSLLFGLAFYIFFSFCLKKIAEKAGIQETGIWWIPIVNLLLLLRVAEKPSWWLILFLVPLANIVVMFIVWIDVSNRLGHGTAWGVIAAILSPIGVPYLAFSDSPNSAVA